MENKLIQTATQPIWIGLLNSPQKYYQDLNPVSQAEILQSHVPAIADVKRSLVNGEQIIQAMLVLEIKNLNDHFNISKPMTESQCILCIQLIIENFNYLKISDFKLCFKFAMLGRYGKVFNRIDAMIIFEWLNAYCDERAEVAENLNRMKHEQHKRGISDNAMDVNPEGQKKVVEILKSAVENITVPEEKPAPKERKKTGAEIFIQRCMNQFDKIHSRKPDNGGQKFIYMYHRNLTLSEYLEYKVDQRIKVIELLNKKY